MVRVFRLLSGIWRISRPAAINAPHNSSRDRSNLAMRSVSVTNLDVASRPVNSQGALLSAAVTLRHLWRMLSTTRIAGRAGRSSPAALTTSIGFPGTIWMYFADPVGVVAYRALKVHNQTSKRLGRYGVSII